MAAELIHAEPIHPATMLARAALPWRRADGARAFDDGGPVGQPFQPFEDAWIGRPLLERLQQVALQHAGRIALDDGAIRLSYRALWSALCQLAQRLGSALPAASPVGILLPHDAHFPVAALACLALGHPYVPIDLKQPAARIAEIVNESGIAAVILDGRAETAHLIPAALVCIDIGAAFGPAGAARMPAGAAVSVDAPAVILYTSGSTGRPKGICNSQRGILQRVAEATNSCHVHADDRFLLLSSFGTIAGVREMLAALLNGAMLQIADPYRHGIGGVLDTLRAGRVTVCYMVPALLRTVLRAPGARQACAHLRVLRVGGDVTLASDLALFRPPVIFSPVSVRPKCRPPSSGLCRRTGRPSSRACRSGMRGPASISCCSMKTACRPSPAQAASWSCAAATWPSATGNRAACRPGRSRPTRTSRRCGFSTPATPSGSAQTACGNWARAPTAR